jgi:tripeptidyl-peptidase-1
VSDPEHRRYGKHLTSEEIDELVRPSLETSQLVKAWLTEHDIDPETAKYTSSGDWMNIDVPVHKANRLLDCQYAVYHHKEEDAKLIRTPNWSLPRYLHDHVRLIEPTNSFMRPLKKVARSTAKFDVLVPDKFANVAQLSAEHVTPNASVAAVCNTDLVTPNCLRTLYGTVNYTQRATDQNRMAIANYLGEVNLKSDLSIYLKNYRSDIVATSATDFKIVPIDGGTTQQTPLNRTQLAAQTGVEGNLDLQTMVGIAHPVPLVSYSTGGQQPGFKPDNFTLTNSNEPYLAWVTYMAGLKDSELPYVVSTSYADDEQVSPPQLIGIAKLIKEIDCV